MSVFIFHLRVCGITKRNGKCRLQQTILWQARLRCRHTARTAPGSILAANGIGIQAYESPITPLLKTETVERQPDEPNTCLERETLEERVRYNALPKNNFLT
jgi:hypothetical protein